MVDFRGDWLPRILDRGELIIDASILSKSWIESNPSQDSAIDYEELIEEIFADLQEDVIVAELDEHIPKHHRLKLAIKKFMEGLESLKSWASHSPDNLTPDQILSSRRWITLRRLSSDMVEAAKKSGYYASDRPGR